MFSLPLAAVFLGIMYVHAHPDIISRPNLGVVFLKEKDLSLSPTIWHHTVAIPFFPEMLQTPVQPLCDPANLNDTMVIDTCSAVQQIHDMYIELRNRVTSDVNVAHVSITDIMTTKPLHSRRKRGWFNLLGNVAKKVMGVATEGDIKILQKHMGHLMDLIHKEKHDRIQDVTKLHSYEVKADMRMNRLQKHLIKLDHTLSVVSDQISTLQTYAHFTESLVTQVHLHGQFINSTFNLIHWLHNFNINIHTLNQIKIAAVSQLADVTHLMRGRLTINLIDPQHLRSILASIQQALNQQSTNLYIKSDINAFYTRDRMVIASHDDKFLYVKIKIPVSSPDTEFSLFKVDAVPVPTSHDSKIHTILQNFQPWLAISKSGNSYIELDNTDVFQIKEVLNQRNFLPTRASNQSCMINLFLGNTQGILQSCQHKLVNNPVNKLEFVYTLPKQGYLIYTPTRVWMLQCQNTSNMSRPATNQPPISHKGLFTIQIQCACKLKSHMTELLPDPTSCPHRLSNTSYSANFLVYYKLYRDTIPEKLTVDTLVPVPVHFELPAVIQQRLNLTDLEIQDSDKEEDKTDLDNFEVSDTTGDDTWTFTDWQDHPSADTIVASVGAAIVIIQILCIAALICIYRQLNHVNAILLTVSAAHFANGFESTKKYTLPTTTIFPPPLASSGDLPLWRTTILIASFTMAFFNFLIIFIEKLIPLIQRYKPSVQLDHLHTKLYCSIYSPAHELSIKLLTIPYNIEGITAMKYVDVSDIRFERNIGCTFAVINWNGLELYAGNRRIMLPTRVKVPFWHFGSLSQLQSTRDHVQFRLVQKENSLVISEWYHATTQPINRPPGQQHTTVRFRPAAATPLLLPDQPVEGTKSRSSSASTSDSGHDDRPSPDAPVLVKYSKHPEPVTSMHSMTFE